MIDLPEIPVLPMQGMRDVNCGESFRNAPVYAFHDKAVKENPIKLCKGCSNILRKKLQDMPDPIKPE